MTSTAAAAKQATEKVAEKTASAGPYGREERLIYDNQTFGKFCSDLLNFEFVHLESRTYETFEIGRFGDKSDIHPSVRGVSGERTHSITNGRRLMCY